MTTILITAPRLAEDAMAMLAENGARVETLPLSASAREMAARVGECDPDGIVSRTVRIDEAALKAGSRLKAVVKHGTGTDNIDVAAATRLGIPVGFTPGANAQSVAELAAALMFALARRLPEIGRAMDAGGWDRAVQGIELSGRRLGLVGYGAIARRLARIGAGIGMELHAFDPHAERAGAEPAVVWHERLEDLLAAADVVSLHCPLTDETRGLIGRDALAAMRPGALLINAARGPIVDEAALVAALEQGRIAGAGLDTFEREPLAAESPLRRMPNVVATPHVGATTHDATRIMATRSVALLFDLLAGRPVDPAGIANPETLPG